MANIDGTSGDDLIHISGDGWNGQDFDPQLNDIALAPNLVLTEGARGNDIVTQTGDDTISAGDGDDVIFSGSGYDVVSGGNGNDIIHSDGGTVIDPDGEDGNGFQVVGGGRISGGNGDDDIFAGYGMTVDGGAGLDTVHLDLTADTE